MPIANPGITRTTTGVAQVVGEDDILVPGSSTQQDYQFRPESITVTWTVHPNGQATRAITVYGRKLKKDGTPASGELGGRGIAYGTDWSPLDQAPGWVSRAVEDLSELAPFSS
jgi:hypothetical protein